MFLFPLKNVACKGLRVIPGVAGIKSRCMIKKQRMFCRYVDCSHRWHWKTAQWINVPILLCHSKELICWQTFFTTKSNGLLATVGLVRSTATAPNKLPFPWCWPLKHTLLVWSAWLQYWWAGHQLEMTHDGKVSWDHIPSVVVDALPYLQT